MRSELVVDDPVDGAVGAGVIPAVQWRDGQGGRNSFMLYLLPPSIQKTPLLNKTARIYPNGGNRSIIVHRARLGYLIADVSPTSPATTWMTSTQPKILGGGPSGTFRQNQYLRGMRARVYLHRWRARVLRFAGIYQRTQTVYPVSWGSQKPTGRLRRLLRVTPRDAPSSLCPVWH